MYVYKNKGTLNGDSISVKHVETPGALFSTDRRKSQCEDSGVVRIYLFY